MTLPQRLLRVVPVVLLASTAYWMTTLDNDDFCGNVGECLGLSFDDLVVFCIAVIAGPLLLRLLGVPRVLLHTLVAVLATSTLWYAAGEILRVLDPDRSYDALVPLPAALAAGLLGGLTAAYVADEGAGRTPRVAAVLAVAVIGVAAGVASDHASRDERTTEIGAVPVTLDGEYPSLTVVLVPTSAEPGDLAS